MLFAVVTPCARAPDGRPTPPKISRDYAIERVPGPRKPPAHTLWGIHPQTSNHYCTRYLHPPPARSPSPSSRPKRRSRFLSVPSVNHHRCPDSPKRHLEATVHTVHTVCMPWSDLHMVHARSPHPLPFGPSRPCMRRTSAAMVALAGTVEQSNLAQGKVGGVGELVGFQ